MTLKNNRKFLLLVISCLLFTFLVPMVSSAVGFPYWGQGGLVSCTGGVASGVPNTGGKPVCTSLCDLLTTAQNIIYFMMTIAVFGIAPIMIVIGGIMMLISGGSEERFSHGKKIATGAVIGVAITLGAFVILNTFFVLIAVGTGGTPPSWFNIQCAVPASAPQSTTQPGSAFEGGSDPGTGVTTPSTPSAPSQNQQPLPDVGAPNGATNF